MRIKFTRIGLFLAAVVIANSSFAHEELQHIRSATFKLTYAGATFLIDPLLAKKGTYPGFEGTFRSELYNPAVDLPIPVEEVIAGVDAVIVTHVHLDHWDDVAQQMLPKDVSLFVQNEADAGVIRSQGFTNVRILHAKAVEFRGVNLSKTAGQHGSDALFEVPAFAQGLGEVMGVVLAAAGHKTVYVAGDTIWCDGVEDAIRNHDPDVIVLNTGNAIISGWEEHPIIMGKEDTLRTALAAPQAIIVAVHMDAINHCSLSREELREYVKANGMEDRVLVPADGEVLKF
jgi:L-ascorbate metabolism protein UlaG (beta-lactamase superfamily)